MANHSQRGGWRLAGRVLGGLAAAWWVVAVVGGAIAGPDSNAEGDAAAEAVGVVVLVAANVSAFAAALVRERLGSRLMVAAGSLFCVFALMTAGRNQVLAMLVSGAPFVLSGLFFRLADLRSRAQD